MGGCGGSSNTNALRNAKYLLEFEQIADSLSAEEAAEALPELKRILAKLPAMQSAAQARFSSDPIAGLSAGVGFEQAEKAIRAAITRASTATSQNVDHSSSQFDGVPLSKNMRKSQGGCFIATACYGSYDHPSVQEFRWFRDAQLNRHVWGRRLVALYYNLSPRLAVSVRRYPLLSSLFRGCILAPMLTVITYFHKDVDREQYLTQVLQAPDKA